MVFDYLLDFFLAFLFGDFVIFVDICQCFLGLDGGLLGEDS